MDIPLNSVYRCLARQRRRQLLQYLLDAEDEVVQVDLLVESVAKEESYSITPDRESIKIDLYHVHLPLLDELDVIDFDRRSETVRYQSHQRLEAELERLSGTERETSPSSP